MLRVVPTAVHGVIDHVTAPVLTFAPEIFRLKEHRRAALPPPVTGAAAAVYSNLTDYELSAVNVIPMPIHLALDGVSGALLATSPRTLRTVNGRRYWLPHMLVGALEVVLALTSETRAPRTKAGRLARVARLPAPSEEVDGARARRLRGGATPGASRSPRPRPPRSARAPSRPR